MSPLETTKNSPDRQHNFWIDVLRGIAILLVLFRHLSLVSPGYRQDETSFAFVLYQIGWVGVDMFFVISGYLIGGILFRQIHATGGFALKWFYIRRAFRILPAYYILLVLIYLAPLSSGVPDREFISSFFFLQNYTNFLPNIFWYHSWSLCVEEHFYLTFPILLWLLVIKGKLNLFPYIALIIMILSLVVRIIHAQYYVVEDLTNFFFTHTRLDEISMGCAIAYLHTFYKEFIPKILRYRRWIIALSILFLFPAGSLDVSKSQFMKTIGVTCNTIGFGGFVFLAASARTPGRLARGSLWPLAKLGIYSYTLYLLHPLMFQLEALAVFTMPLYKLFSTVLATSGSPNTAYMISYLTLAVLVAVFYSFLFERPFLYIRNRYFP